MYHPPNTPAVPSPAAQPDVVLPQSSGTGRQLSQAPAGNVATVTLMPAAGGSGGAAVVDGYSGLARPLNSSSLPPVCGSAEAESAAACLRNPVLKTSEEEIVLTLDLGGGVQFDMGGGNVGTGSIGPAITVSGNATVAASPVQSAFVLRGRAGCSCRVWSDGKCLLGMAQLLGGRQGAAVPAVPAVPHYTVCVWRLKLHPTLIVFPACPPLLGPTPAGPTTAEVRIKLGDSAPVVISVAESALAPYLTVGATNAASNSLTVQRDTRAPVPIITTPGNVRVTDDTQLSWSISFGEQVLHGRARAWVVGQWGVLTWLIALAGSGVP